MRKFASYVLVLVMLAALFSGCGEQKKLLGTWECTVDVSDVILQLLDAQKLSSELDISGFAVTAQLSFLEDNTFRLELDQQKLAASFDTLLQELEDGLIGLLQEQLGVQGLGITVEELLALTGLTKEDLTEQLRRSLDGDQLMQALSAELLLEGFYQVKGDKLLFCADEETKLENVYTLYTVEETVLTLSTHVGENSFLGEHSILRTAPVTFTRVN